MVCAKRQLFIIRSLHLSSNQNVAHPLILGQQYSDKLHTPKRRLAKQMICYNLKQQQTPNNYFDTFLDKLVLNKLTSEDMFIGSINLEQSKA